MSKIFDIVIFGATSVTGEIITRNLAERYGVDGEISWAVAGRNDSKLIEVKQRCNAANVPHLLAEASSEEQLRALAAQARVILSTVGPFALYGEPLVKVCAETGTDYCDITGEIHWVKQMIDRYEDQARASGARLVPCSGFDSIPSDLGVYYLQQQSQQRFGSYCHQVKNRVARFSGGFSGGAAMSFLNVIQEAANDSQVRSYLDDPYCICPAHQKYTQLQNEIEGAQFDDDFNTWVAPFMIAPTNMRNVLRSNALLGDRYGENFLYEEASFAGKGVKGRISASMMSLVLKAFWTFGAIGPMRALIKKLLPEVGQGPSLEEQEKGCFDLRFIGRTAHGRSIRVKVSGDKDPGFGSTAQMATESAICLLQTPDAAEGGFWTPSSLFGERLIARLEQNAGIRFEVTA